MKHKILIILCALAVSACDSTDDQDRVIGELTSDRIELSAEFSEPVVEILVAEGEHVTAGQMLLRQNNDRARARLAEAEAVYLQSKARLDELVRGPRIEQIAAGRANVEGATQDLGFRQSEQKRIVDIHARGLSSAESLDRANAMLDAAQANLKLHLAQLEELLTGTTIEELSQAEQAVNQTTARRDAAQIDVDRHSILAPVDGVVDSRLFELGERPVAGQPLVIMLSGQQVFARVYVPEHLRARVSAGTQARIFVDGLDEAIAGHVRWISSEAAFTPYFALTERDRGRLSFVAKVDISEERARLPDGVPVEVELLLE
jgi:HlyD family secretion protein